MVKVIIDGVGFESISKAALSMPFDTKEMTDVERARDAVDVEVEIVCETTEAAIFLGEGYLHVAERFNASRHTAQLCYESEVVFEGDATLRKVVRRGDDVIFRVRIRRSGATWAENSAKAMLSDLEVDYEKYLNVNTVEQSWYNDDIVKFFPVHRDSYSPVYSTTSPDVVDRVLSIDEYHPFLNIYMVLDTIFSNAGYSLESSLLETEWFKSLYMSGGYDSQRSEAARSSMDFYVTKLSDVSTTADYRGRVSFSPYIASSTVGNFVDSASVDESAECYSRSSCVSTVSGAFRFTPITQVNVGFEYRFRYITGYTIKSRTKLKALDTFYLESGDEITVGVANKFEDQRGKLIKSKAEYVAVIFNHTSGDDGDVIYKLNVHNDGGLVTTTEWMSRTQEFTTPTIEDEQSTQFSLFASYDGGSNYTTYSGDWAVYQGYVDVEGTTEVDVTLRTPPETISPTSPKTFTGHYIDGAEPGTYFKLLAGTTLRPYFAAYPGVGSKIEFEDVSKLGVSQSSVISAMQHLFNLRIFTDHIAKKVYIEPLEEFYDSTKTWDWSGKIVEGADVIYEDVANELHRHRRWGYKQADGATTRSQEFGYVPGETYPDPPEAEPEQSIEGAFSTEFGSWSIGMEHYGAKASSISSLSPLFSPTLNDTNGLPIVGDRDDEMIVDTMAFSPRILGYLGMQSFGNEEIPHTAFHAPEEDFTLCFEDRDEMFGLNRFRLQQIKRDSVSQYVTLSLRLSPLDMAALLSPVVGMASVMSHFRFEIDGEWCECRMEAIIRYDLTTGIASCKFLIIH